MGEPFNDAESELVYLRAKVVEQKVESKKLKGSLSNIQNMVNEQAEDEGLWCEAQTAPEAYLQRKLRELHGAIEGK